MRELRNFAPISFSAQLTSNRISGTPSKAYVTTKHLTHLAHLAKLNPRSIRRCQITSQVQSWNSRRGPYKHLDRAQFLQNLAVMCNTSVEEILSTYSLVPVRSDANDTSPARAPRAAHATSAGSACSASAQSAHTPRTSISHAKRRRLMTTESEASAGDTDSEVN